MKFLKKLFGRKSTQLDDVLDPRKRINIRGVDFVIRKINPVDHLHGAKVLAASYEVKTLESRKKEKELQGQMNLEKAKDHFRDVFTQCVIEPKIVRKESDAGVGMVFVDRLFLDWDIANELYQEIMIFTYGKKKVQQTLDQYL